MMNQNKQIWWLSIISGVSIVVIGSVFISTIILTTYQNKNSATSKTPQNLPPAETPTAIYYSPSSELTNNPECRGYVPLATTTAIFFPGTVVPSTVKGWKTYRNAQYGFEISAPQEYSFTEEMPYRRKIIDTWFDGYRCSRYDNYINEDYKLLSIDGDENAPSISLNLDSHSWFFDTKQKVNVFENEYVKKNSEDCTEPFLGNNKILSARTAWGEGGDVWYSDYMLNNHGQGLKIGTSDYDCGIATHDEEGQQKCEKQRKERMYLEERILKTFKFIGGTHAVAFRCKIFDRSTW